MKKLVVEYRGWGEQFALGTLVDLNGQIYYEYSAPAVARGLQLSPLKLPLRPLPFTQFPAHQLRLPGLIADALPDGWGRLLMDRLFRSRGRDPRTLSPLDRLAFIGERAIGALAFVPAEEPPLPAESVELLALAQEVRQVQSDKDVALLRYLAVLGGSPHGARPKALVNFDPASGRMTTDEAGLGSPWLVKFPAQGEHPEACAIEALYAHMARLCGIEVPETRYFDVAKNLSAFGIARFDRHAGRRVPTLTVAGALDLDFTLPSLDYVDLLRLTQHLSHDRREVMKAFDRCVFNVVMHNRDDHTKNFAFRLDQHGAWKLAPAYDLTFCLGPGGEHQMSVCGEGRAPARANLLNVARQAGIEDAVAGLRIDRVTEVAGSFAQHAKAFAIRRSTQLALKQHIEANRMRMLAC